MSSTEQVILTEVDEGQTRAKMRIKCIRNAKHLIHLYMHSNKFQIFIKHRSKSTKPKEVRIFRKFE